MRHPLLDDVKPGPPGILTLVTLRLEDATPISPPASVPAQNPVDIPPPLNTINHEEIDHFLYVEHQKQPTAQGNYASTRRGTQC